MKHLATSDHLCTKGDDVCVLQALYCPLVHQGEVGKQ